VGRNTEVISLACGNNILPEEIEAHYRRSPYVKEICVVGMPHDSAGLKASQAAGHQPADERLYAVVVPDMELMRKRRIVNVGDLLRFELEGLSVHLPVHKRVLMYDVWFQALPKTAAGVVNRQEVKRRIREKPDPGPQNWHAHAAASLILGRAKGAVVTRESSLELDLGLDSMDRVELITELEQRLGVRISEEQVCRILTVGELIDAIPSACTPTHGELDRAWTMILRDLPSASDPLLGGLLGGRALAGSFLFAVIRVMRLLWPRLRISGIEDLPRTGPYILSPNHQSYLDPFIICGALPYRVFRQLFFVGAAEYFETPFMRWLARQCNCVPVDPDANLVPAMKAGAFGLAHGKILLLFPEGERSIDGEVKRFKKGAPILAHHRGVPIVPVAIRGAFELWPRSLGINWKVLRPWSAHVVSVTFGRPLRFDGPTDYANAAATLRDKVAELWRGLESRSGGA